MDFRKLKIFVKLFIGINKNYFFEKYSFLSFKEETKALLFKLWYCLRSTIIILGITWVLKFVFNSDLVNTVVYILILLSLFLGMDVKDWRLFYRLDFISAIPEIRCRFTTVLFGNVMLKLFIENNMLLLMLLCVLYGHLPLFYFPLLSLAYVLLYASVLTVYFLLENSSFIVKGIFSIINYIFSFNVTIVVIYYILYFIFSIFSKFVNNLTSANIIGDMFDMTTHAIMSSVAFINDNIIVAGVIYVSYIMLVGILTLVTFRYLKRTSYMDKEHAKYAVNNFLYVRLVRKFMRKDTVMNGLVAKEYALFAYFYKYNFKEYFFICIADRAMAFFIAIWLILLKYEYSETYLLMFAVTLVVMLVDINSSVGVKLLTNMSFITDYNALLSANTSGFDIQTFIKAKLRFYYTIKLVPYGLFFIVYNIMFSFVHMPWWLVIISNFLNLVIILIFPKLYLTNNLIYSRMNYRDYEKYLDESKLLDIGVKEFYPLNYLFRIWVFLVVIILGCTTIFRNAINVTLLTIGLIIFLIISIVIVYGIMKRIYHNIITFIERGEYSADFAKIFKK